MKIVFGCDLHLPRDHRAVQYDAFEFLLGEARKAELFVFAGDISANGDIGTVRYFLEKVSGLDLLSAVIAGNSDLRTAETAGEISGMFSSRVILAENIRVFLISDADGRIADEDFRLLESASDGDIVVTHHPARNLGKRFFEWRSTHSGVRHFFGHIHSFAAEGNDVSLLAADPDKAIGEEPGLVIFDTVSGEIERRHFSCPMPELSDFIGLSCMKPLVDIPYATRERLRVIELRGNSLSLDRRVISELIGKWRGAGGRMLSLHAPEIRMRDGVISADGFDEFLEFANFLGVDRITLHVPDMSVSEAALGGLDRIVEFASEKLALLPEGCAIGIENMHMTAGDTLSDRRFGYTPDECREYIKKLRSALPERMIGFHLDIGHARNNRPLSEEFTLGEWYAELGNEINGYHIHQVTPEFENHTPVVEPYGRLISLASLFRCWENRTISHAPLIVEVRGGAYDVTIKLLRGEKL